MKRQENIDTWFNGLKAVSDYLNTVVGKPPFEEKVPISLLKILVPLLGQIIKEQQELRKAITTPVSVPAGHVVVPVEPTEAIIEAMCQLKLNRLMRMRDGDESANKGIAQGCYEEYRAMIAAAPPAPAQSDRGGSGFVKDNKAV